jgi:hypothetical protein
MTNIQERHSTLRCLPKDSVLHILNGHSAIFGGRKKIDLGVKNSRYLSLLMIFRLLLQCKTHVDPIKPSSLPTNFVSLRMTMMSDAR